MDKFSRHSEENFWPCVSDMFLALFVIALVMYTTASNEKGQADKYIAEVTLEEACGLFRDLASNYPENNFFRIIDTKEFEASQKSEIRNPNGNKNLPELAEHLFRVYEQPEFANLLFRPKAELFPAQNETGNGYNFGTYSYTQAVRFLYYSATGEQMETGDPCYDDRLREVRKKLVSLKGDGNNTDKLEEEIRRLKQKLQELRKQLEKWEKKSDEIDALKKSLALLEKELQRLLEKYRFENWQEVIVDLNKKINILELEIEEIKKHINEWKDNRVMVMEVVQKILKKDAYKSLQAKSDMQTGVIRIPGTAIGFAKGGLWKSSGFRPLPRRASRVSDEKDGTPRLDSDKSSQNLDLLAQLLKEIAEKIKKEKLPVDNIAIECHTDSDNYTTEGKTLGKYYNDGLSLNRAFFIWDEINKKVQIDNYTNEAQLPLFTLSGFGCRVKAPEAKGSGDSENRRIEIRVNCSPTIKTAE